LIKTAAEVGRANVPADIGRHGGRPFKKLVKGPYESDEFIHLSPGEVVTQEMFIG